MSGTEAAVIAVPPAAITEARRNGWPTFHPEDFCHRCGARNMLWYADRDDWLTATSAWAAATGREGICCPRCFSEMHREATGERIVWHLTPAPAPVPSPEEDA